MAGYTRRTHIVRVPMDTKPPLPGKKLARYIDIEVLDAIAFRIDNGKEVIIDMAVANSRPLIIDNTGGGHERRPREPTQRTHMERVTTSDGRNAIDIEVIDLAAFRDQNGREWILDMRDNANRYDVTDHTGDSASTRRCHDEKVYVGGKAPKPGEKGGNNFLTCQRNDAIAFRTINGREVVFTCPSSDAPGGRRAATYIWSPSNYDPSNDKGPVPPINTDPHVYVAPLKGKGFLTAAAKLNMGPFWWIRKVHSGAQILLRVSTIGVQNHPAPNITEMDIAAGTIIDQTEETGSSTTTTITGPQYWLWYNFGDPFPGFDPAHPELDLSYLLPADSAHAHGLPAGPFSLLSDAEAVLAAINKNGFYHIETDVSGASGVTITTNTRVTTFLIDIPEETNVITITFDGSAIGDNISLDLFGWSNSGPYSTVAEAKEHDGDTGSIDDTTDPAQDIAVTTGPPPTRNPEFNGAADSMVTITTQVVNGLNAPEPNPAQETVVTVGFEGPPPRTA